jgi:ornithine cyclodeaminase/alanine dehydrogenase-like protein (mu-crystallin family)
MKQPSESEITAVLDFKSLIETLDAAFASKATVPMRHHHNFTNPASTLDSTLLLMPAWDNQKYLGVKIVTVSPENANFDLPTIQGMYLLFDIKTGVPLMRCDAKTLTNLRTAAASALASKYLSKKDSNILLMVGTGALAPQLIKAHATVRPIEKVYILGRNFEKAQQLANQLKSSKVETKAVEKIESVIAEADIISCATLSEKPLIKGAWLRPGQHLDLVGSYQKHTREADDEVVKKAAVFVDTLQGAPKESGDLFIPIQNGIFKIEDIKADLFGMCQSEKDIFRNNETEITFFKSVGHALEDLAAASLAFERISP